MNQTTLETLEKAGMDEKEAEIYLILAENGESTVPVLLEHTQLSRATVYEVLPQLLAEEFIEYRKDGRVAYYRAVHPTKLLDLLDQKKRQLALLEEEMNETVRQVVGSFQLANSKPGVRFFEGKEGVINAYEEILQTGQSIDSIEDKGEMSDFIPDYFPTFIKKRIEKNIYNRVVAPASNMINITSEKEKRETRSLPVDIFPFGMDIKISANTILFATLKKEGAIALLIEDTVIADNFRVLFEYLWSQAAARTSDAKNHAESVS